MSSIYLRLENGIVGGVFYRTVDVTAEQWPVEAVVLSHEEAAVIRGILDRALRDAGLPELEG